MVAKSVWAVPELDFLVKFQTKVEPYFKTWNVGSFFGKDQVELVYRSLLLENEKAALVLLPGRGETIYKYAEVVYDLRALGFSIYILEHRGQGESGRVEGVGPQYVQSYSDYVQDLDAFVRTVVMTQPHSKLFLMGHSMGGAIATLYAAKHPGIFKALVLSAPMFDMNTQAYSKKTAQALAKFLCLIGLGKSTAAKDSGQVTSCEARNDMGIQAADKYSKAEWRKVSYQWVLASLEAIALIQEICSKLTLPILLLQAEKDLHVPAAGQDQFCKHVASCRKVVISNSFHEVLMETDSIRNVTLAQVQKFLASV